MSMWLQKVVLTVVAVVPVIVGEIVRATDDGAPEAVVLVAPCRPADRAAPAVEPTPALPPLELEEAGGAPFHGC